MKCDMCAKRDATAMITTVMGGRSTVRRVCARCVRRLQRGDAFATQMAILGTMEAPAEKLVCPACGRTSDQLRGSGIVGCPTCYQAFAPILQPLAVRLNGAFRQPEADATAEAPADAYTQRLNRLREEMFSAVNAEEYERAAQLRDAIRALEREGESGRE